MLIWSWVLPRPLNGAQSFETPCVLAFRVSVSRSSHWSNTESGYCPAPTFAAHMASEQS
jgi:hypothetical protein